MTFDPCPSCGKFHGDIVGCRAGKLEAINTMLDRHRANRVVKNDFQEGVMAALLMLNVEITREQFDELMITKASEYADGRAPVCPLPYTPTVR